MLVNVGERIDPLTWFLIRQVGASNNGHINLPRQLLLRILRTLQKILRTSIAGSRAGGGRKGVITVQRTGGSHRFLVVNFSEVDKSAIRGSNQRLISGDFGDFGGKNARKSC